MVMKTKLVNKKYKDGAAAAKTVPTNKEVIYVRSKFSDKGPVSSDSGTSVDVIDLGAPRILRRAPAEQLLPSRASAPQRRPYTPNPRLYPGPVASKPKRKQKRSAGRARSRRVFRRPVPNARLYRPAPRRVIPPPAPQRTPPPPPARAPPPPPTTLDTASRAALRLTADRGPPPAPLPSRRLVLTLPQAAAAMDNARHSTSPEDCSDGNDAASAPSEFLAEFLSAIMRRQYAEALKYCRLILQYEPHNATARGFYPLLQHKVDAHKNNDAASRRNSASGSSGGRSSSGSPRLPPEGRWRGGSSSEGSVASQSSLELDSSSASPPSSAKDSNGNPPPLHPTPDDLENDNDVSTTFQEPPTGRGAAALRRLRAHFACSIK